MKVIIIKANINKNKNNNNNNNNEVTLYNWEEQAKLDSQQSFRKQMKHMNNSYQNKNDNNNFR